MFPERAGGNEGGHRAPSGEGHQRAGGRNTSARPFGARGALKGRLVSEGPSPYRPRGAVEAARGD